VIIVGRADEAVVGDIHQLPKILDAGDDMVDILLRRNAGRLGLLLDLLAVFVGAGQEHHVIALQPLVARHDVGGDGAVAVADVELVRRIINRRRDIKFLFFHFDVSLPEHILASF